MAWLSAPAFLFLFLVTSTWAADSGRPASASADRPDTAVYVLPLETIVTATRQGIPLRDCPAATSVVGRERLARSPRGVSVNEALASVPGVRIDNAADGERVHLSIRGQGILTERGIRGIKVVLDGLPLNDPTGTAPDLYDIDWAGVERVEVLRGPAGALYGGGGSGGVINVVTRDGADRPGTSAASFTGGSYGFRKALAEVGGTTGPLNYHVSLSQAAADGYRDHNAFWADNLYGKLRWSPSSSVEIQQVLGWTDYYEQNAEGLNLQQVQENRRQANPDAAPFDEFYKTGRFTGGLTGRFGFATDQSLRLSACFRSTKYKEPRPRELQRRLLVSPGATLQYDLDWTAGGVKNHLSAGCDAAWQSIDEARFYNPGRANEDSLLANANVQQRGVGTFLIDRVELAEHWSLMLSGRYDGIDNQLYDHAFKDNPDLSGRKSFHRATGRAGLAWSPTPTLGLYGNWGQGFLPPATEELINNPVTYGGFNQDLTFATSIGEEVGIRGGLPGSLSYELTGFLLDTKNDFDRYRITGREGLTFYRNLGFSRRFGAETHLGWTRLRRMSTDVAYTWSRFAYTRPDAVKDHWLPNSPEHMLSMDVEYLVLPRLTVGVESEMQSRWLVDSQNSASVAGFALWGASLTYGWRAGGLRGDAMVGARNVFGAKYLAFTEPDPDGNSYQPGPDEEYFARLSVSR
jgi:iron complex outermembrane receptor protein